MNTTVKSTNVRQWPPMTVIRNGSKGDQCYYCVLACRYLLWGTIWVTAMVRKCAKRRLPLHRQIIHFTFKWPMMTQLGDTYAALIEEFNRRQNTWPSKAIYVVLLSIHYLTRDFLLLHCSVWLFSWWQFLRSLINSRVACKIRITVSMVMACRLHLNQCWIIASCPPYSFQLTHWGRDKMAAIFQTTFSNAFYWMKIYEFRLKFHWSLFLRVQLTIFKHCFR